MGEVSVGAVVAQFHALLDLIDASAMVAVQAREEAERAGTAYAEVSRGTNDPLLEEAVTRSRAGADKAGEVSRSLADAATCFAAYVNRIAPGSVPARDSAPDSMPSGADVVTASSGRGRLANRMMDRLMSVANADDGLQHGKQLGNILQQATGSGGVAVPRSSEPVITSTNPPGGATAGDALLAAFTVAILGIKGVEVAERIRRKARPSSQREDRDDSQDA
ncbi:hypothetical protein O7627_07555 [Solwaraspora sp. WMMD1047]|uniref:hypothetical protein n=1 Tax=Solwaraspora sp. WMMD1047 TaxID=3016102 RepID=UPI002417B8D9|nr:hypothetical protein [Solwaraspora sp. WMMD1047]MDG4829161.1 hypothetical protein [Solwaraspora sp. WMMD1047]